MTSAVFPGQVFCRTPHDPVIFWYFLTARLGCGFGEEDPRGESHSCPVFSTGPITIDVASTPCLLVESLHWEVPSRPFHTVLFGRKLTLHSPQVGLGTLCPLLEDRVSASVTWNTA